jgi:Bacterial Ig-like domain (group 3)/FG-GAP-like repeat
MNRAVIILAILFSLTSGLVESSAARQISFAPAKTFSAGMTQPAEIAVADLNGDGKPDLVVANHNGQLAIFIAKSNGTFLPPTIVTLDFYVTGSIAIGDFNGDKKPDIVAVGGGNVSGIGLALLTGNGDGTFNPPQYFPTALSGSSISLVVGDFNKDGNSDIYVGGNGSSELILGDGKGNFHDTQLQNASGFSVAVGDFNGDGNLDVASSEPYGEYPNNASALAVLLGNGDGTFQSPQMYPGFNNYQGVLGVAVADLNHDNKLDLVATDYAGGGVLVFLGKGDGTFNSPTGWAAGNQAGTVTVADFNGDGNLDLAVSDFGGGGITVLPGNGDGTFVPPYPPSDFPTGKNPTGIVVADFNHDGSPDIAVANYGDGTISILLNAAGTFVRIHSSIHPSTSGQPVTFTATVRPSIAHSPLPSGLVTFTDGSVILGQSQLSNGSASLTTSMLAKGRHKISADYDGDETFNPNQSGMLVENVK